MDINGQSIEATSTPSVGQNVANNAYTTNQGVADTYGSSAGRGLLNASNNNFEHTTGTSTAQMDAIRSRYMPQFNRTEQQLSLDNLKGASMDRLRNLQVATQAAGEEVQMNRQKALLKNKIDQANRAARGAVFGHVLGIVGGVVAGIYSGGTGAAAGFAAGEAAGNAIGGS